MGLSFAKKSMSSRLVTMSIAPFDISSTKVFGGNYGMSPAFAMKAEKGTNKLLLFSRRARSKRAP